MIKKQTFPNIYYLNFELLQTSISSYFLHQIVDLSTKSSLVYKKLCAVALLAFEKHFHLGSETSDYITMLNSYSMKTSLFTDLLFSQKIVERVNPGRGTCHNGLYREALPKRDPCPKRGTLFGLEIYKKGRDFTSWSIQKGKENLKGAFKITRST